MSGTKDSLTAGSNAGGSGTISVDGTGSTLTVNGYFAIGYLGTGNLSVTNSASLVTTGGFSIGAQAGSVGTVVVASGASDDTASIGIGFHGQGALTVRGGGAFTTGFMDIGQTVGASGSVSVSGAGSKLESTTNISVGDASFGSLSVTVGATATASTGLGVGNLYGSTGAVTIASAGTLTTTGISVGNQAGSTGSIGIAGADSALVADGYAAIGGFGAGTLSITAGGAFSDSDTADGVSIANQAGGTGGASVSGKGSTLTDAGYLQVGWAGTGTLAISNAGAVSISNAAQGIDVGGLAGANGAITVQGAGSAIVDPGYLTLGDAGAGSLSVSSGAAVTAGASVILGLQTGATGSLTLSGDSKLTTTDISAGVAAASSGSVTVTGAGAILKGDGYFALGSFGEGSLTVAAGGAVTDSSTTQGITAGNQVGGTGTIQVAGAGSKLTDAGFLQVGWAGAGALSITAGGAVSVTDTTVGTAVLVGGLAGAAGAVTVSGAGSTLSDKGGLSLGYVGGSAGSMLISSGGSASAVGVGVGVLGVGALTISTGGPSNLGGSFSTASLAIGETVGASGSVSVTGAGSKLSTTSGYAVGYAGYGSLSVTAGATASATHYLIFGDLAGSYGAGTITGSTVSVGTAGVAADGVAIGFSAGKGVLTMGAGGVLNDADGAMIGIGSALVMAGGKFKSTGLGNAGSISGFGTIAGPLVNTGTIDVSGGVLMVNAAVTGAGTVEIDSGTAQFANPFNENVTFTGTAGTLALAHSQAYTAKITGFSLTGGTALDLGDIAFSSGVTTASYAGTAASGVLTVTSGADVAKIKLVGNYLSSAWTLSSDGNGGTTVVDPAEPALAAAPAHGFVQAIAGFGSAAGGAATTSTGEAFHGAPVLLASQPPRSA